MSERDSTKKNNNAHNIKTILMLGLAQMAAPSPVHVSTPMPILINPIIGTGIVQLASALW